MVKLVKFRQQGVALPVMLIILVVMLVSSVYLLKSSNTSTLSAANMAYDSALNKAADLGLHTGYAVLLAKATSNKKQLESDDLGKGYVSFYDASQSTASDAFWTNAVTVKNTAAQNGTASDDNIQYVVHRACSSTGPVTDASNACVETTGNLLGASAAVGPGRSLSAGTPIFTPTPQIHYIITARIYGPRGGNVVNQMVVLIDV